MRLADQNPLHVLAIQLSNNGMRTFATTAPILWNTLLVNIKGAGSINAFKKRLISIVPAEQPLPSILKAKW